MPRRSAVPRYTLHKPTGQARVRFQGRDQYLGRYGTPESHERYARFVAELALHPTTADGAPSILPISDPDLQVDELILQYLRYARDFYGPNSTEPGRLRDALRLANELFGSERARNFGPLALKMVRQKMIELDYCRTEINSRISRIRRAFKWAVSEQLISPSVLEGLKSVEGLRRGRSSIRESAPVRPVDTAVVEETMKYLSPPVAAICRLQLLTGMRPSEIMRMRPADIDRTGEVWIYRPYSHKTQHLGLDKQVALGPQAQAVITTFLNRAPEEYLFSPAEAEAWRYEQLRQSRKSQRKTKIYPSELKAREAKKAAAKARIRKRPFCPSYNPASYRRAINYGLTKASKAGVTIPHWFPYQVRHTHGTTVRRKYGLEAAQVMLGHANADVTQVYAERNLDLATKVAREIG